VRCSAGSAAASTVGHRPKECSSSFDGLFEHRWRNGTALFETQLTGEHRAGEPSSSSSSSSRGLQEKAGAYEHADADTQAQQQPGLCRTKAQSSRASAESHLSARRHARRLRRRRVDTTAAMAGALAGVRVEPSSLLHVSASAGLELDKNSPV
jgi:hypothetical protein